MVPPEVLENLKICIIIGFENISIVNEIFLVFVVKFAHHKQIILVIIKKYVFVIRKTLRLLIYLIYLINEYRKLTDRWFWIDLAVYNE